MPTDQAARATFPGLTRNATNYWVSVLFQPSGQQNKTESMFSECQVPSTAATHSDRPMVLGTVFQVRVKGDAIGARYYKAIGDDGTHYAYLFDNASKKLLATAQYPDKVGSSGWQEVKFGPVPLEANHEYTIAYSTAHNLYAETPWFFKTAFDIADLHMPQRNGVYAVLGR